jgi:hypothetical protein
MTKTKRLKLELDLPEDDDDRREKRRDDPRPPSRLRWLVARSLFLLVLLAVLVLIAPSVLSASGVWKSVLNWAAPELAAQIDAGSLSLAWWSPIEVRDLVVKDEQGQPIAEVPLVRSQKSLWQIAANSQDLGTFEISQPKAKVVLRAGGSNIEDFLARLPKADSDGGPSSPVRVGVVLTGGTIELDDTIARRQWVLGDVNLELSWPTAGSKPKSGKLSGTIHSSPHAPREASISRSEMSTVSAEFTWEPGEGESLALGAGQANVKLNGVPTELVEGALSRFVADIRPQGPLTLDAAYVWTDNAKSQQVIVRQLAAPQLVVAAPPYLGEDRLAVHLASGQADVLLAGDQLDIKSLRLESNVLQIAGSGSAALGAIASGGADVEVAGQIDLAELARQLPGTLRLKQDTQLQSGVVQVSLTSRQQPGGRTWQGSLKTDRIQATAAGRPIAFNQPLEIGFGVRSTSAGLVIDQLTGRASFLNLDGQGTFDEGTLTASADLDKLVAELGRLIDWRDIQLAGSLGAQVRWNRGPSDLWTAQADARVQNFVFASAGSTPWQERDLQVGADLTGVVAAGTLTELRTGKLTVLSGGDRLEASLTEPVKQVTSTASWPLTFSLQGDLATWMPRVQPFVSLAGWEFAGTIDARGAGSFSPALCAVGPTHVEIDQLEVAGPSLWIREPKLKLDTAGSWDQAKMTLSLPQTTLQSTSLGLRADDLRLVASPQPAMTGVIDFRGNPAQLSDWIGAKGAARAWQVAGELTGRMEIADRGTAHEATITADIDKFQFLTPESSPHASREGLVSRSETPTMAPRWNEAKVSLTGLASYDPTAGKVTLTRSNLKTDWADVAASGTISELATQCLADLKGEISYDLALVEAKIKTDLVPRGPQDDPKKQRSIDTLVLRGQEKRPFVLRGPLVSQLAGSGLVPDQLVGEASLGWQEAQYVGLVAGAADFKARLEQGTVFIGPLDIPVSEGRLTTAPRILLNDPVPHAVVDRGPLIQNVRITPEMCNQWLKYVAPLLADATEAQGTFSLSLENAAVPLFAPLASTVDGSLAIHGAQVGPGPLARQYLQTARQLKTIIDPTAAQGDNYGRWLVMPEHNVAFAVRDGIVSHDGLTMTAQNFVLNTKGHVRIADQAIELDALIPIQESWFKKKEQQGLLTAVRGQAIPIKVTGTLAQPKFDSRSLTAFGKQYASAAVQGLLDKGQQKVQGLLEKEAGKVLGGLDNLFGPKPAPQPAQPAPRTMP